MPSSTNAKKELEEGKGRKKSHNAALGAHTIQVEMLSGKLHEGLDARAGVWTGDTNMVVPFSETELKLWVGVCSTPVGSE